MRFGHRVVMVLILPFLMCGCFSSSRVYPMGAVKAAAGRVDTSDGVDAFEATLLAQNFIYSKTLHHRLYSLDPIRIQLREIPDANDDMIYEVDKDTFEATYRGDRYWEIQFRDREGSLFWGFYPLFPFFVEVNASDGRIIHWGLRK